MLNSTRPKQHNICGIMFSYALTSLGIFALFDAVGAFHFPVPVQAGSRNMRTTTALNAGMGSLVSCAIDGSEQCSESVREMQDEAPLLA